MKGQNYNFQKVDKRLITNSNDLKFLECLKEPGGRRVGRRRRW